MIQPLDDWNAPEPFLLQRQNRAFSDGDGAMLAHRSKALLDVPVPHQRREHIAHEDAFLITDDMLGRPLPRPNIVGAPRSPIAPNID